jgi:predicted nucleic acid-binding protein
VVIDTHLVLSALVFAGGRLAPLRLAWQTQRVLLLVSRATAAELIRALPYCKTVRIPVPPPATPPCQDAFDVMFQELALAGKADALVTGDKDLLSLDGTLACPILGAERFLEEIGIRP